MTTDRRTAALALVATAVAAATGSVQAAQPHMEAALAALQQARAELEKATPDKGGHRVASIQAVEAAITEVKRGIEFDKTH
jgi:hypothetical protein